MYGILKHEVRLHDMLFKKGEVLCLQNSGEEGIVEHKGYNFYRSSFDMLKREVDSHQELRSLREEWASKCNNLQNEVDALKLKSKVAGGQLLEIENLILPLIDGEEPGTDSDHVRMLMNELQEYRAAYGDKHEDKVTIGGKEFKVLDRVYTVSTLKIIKTEEGEMIPRGTINKCRIITYKVSRPSFVGSSSSDEVWGYQFIEGSFSGAVIDPKDCIELVVGQ